MSIGMRINVTQEDIDAGTKGNCSSCPIAIAICRNVVSRAVVSVGSYSVQIGFGGRLRKIRLPLEAIDFVLEFDNGFTVSPFEFDLDVPKEAV